jgi:hypothetical protein
VQEGVSLRACGFLDAQVLRRGVVGDINVADDNRSSILAANARQKLLVAVCGRT